MAGHSKWANIKHRKSAQDAKKSKIFQKVSREILIAIKEGGNDPSKNSKLRLAIEKAKIENLPNSNIKKLLSKTNKDTSNWTRVLYEGYGISGIAFLVITLTDNVNRTSPAIKSLFSKNGGNLGTPGSVNYLFKQLGIIIFEKKEMDFDTALQYSLESNILNIYKEEGWIVLETNPENLLEAKYFFEKKGITNFLKSEIEYVAKDKIEINDEKKQKILNFINALEENDDVQEIYTNMAE